MRRRAERRLPRRLEVRRRARIGLRIRIVAALLAVAAVALAGPAYELLSPLQLRLRERTMHQLTIRAEQIGRDVQRLPRASISPRGSGLRQLDRQLTYRNLDATIVGPDGRYLFGYDSDITTMVRRGTAPAVGRVQHRVINYGYGWGDWARVVIRVPTRGGLVTIAVYRSLQDATTARHALIAGLEPAAAVSLLIAVAFGMLLANGIVRRTRSLRDMALSVATHGPAGTTSPDSHRDEIGDLARAFDTMRERLHAQEVARDRFVATASHELRTPITGLQLRLGMLREDLESGAPDLDDASEQVRLAERQSQRLGKLAGDLLELSRLDAEVALPLSPVVLGPVVQSVASEFEGIPGAVVTTDVDAAGTVLADDGRVAQIVRILIDNARRYSPPDREVRVRAAGAVVTVEDDGPGVGDDERELIFERFRRGAGHHDESGFGLGLAIGQELAQLMGGELTLSSRARPTRFALRLDPTVGDGLHRPRRLPETEPASTH